MKDFKNYHQIDVNKKIEHDGKLIFQAGLKGFQSETVSIDEKESVTCLITSKFSNGDGMTKYILGLPEDIYIGGVVNWDSQKWLITTFPSFNKIYKKAEIRLCNSSIQLTTNDKWIDSDKISEVTGKPIKTKVPGEVIEIPCVFERSTSINGTDLAVNLPDGQANITIPNINNDKIKIGLLLSFFGEDYLVNDIDYSKVYGDRGTIKLIAKKKVRGDGSA
ncbi:hypothetical protein B34_00382 [Bacillus licheniformis]|uniref:hypothetical protein n=1 Tax=Bacillus licheniformis TaxID=1402 RepID=UPI0009B72DDD|nr:hypothetical protein [Bacillus licheniformis]ARC67825.1 hypothetical protein B34_00382 [Bacillus licheniformis]